MNALGRHPWTDDTGKLCPRAAAIHTANLILGAGGQASTAFQCAAIIAKDLEGRQKARRKTEGERAE